LLKLAKSCVWLVGVVGLGLCVVVRSSVLVLSGRALLVDGLFLMLRLLHYVL
jgi:hypothetical protein